MSFPQSIEASTNSTAPKIDTLIIVACHAIYLGGPTNGEDASEWLIEPFQDGETPTFIEHIRRGVQELASSRGRALLVFSGGATKKTKTGGQVVRTEAEGYMDVALRNNLFGFDDRNGESPSSLEHRMFNEGWATDSYQNILLSLIQYTIWTRELQARVSQASARDPSLSISGNLLPPKRLIIISHEFKRARFTELHLPAIRSIWPSPTEIDQMQSVYIGINPPFDEQKLKEVEEGDRKRGYGAWEKDLYGNGKLLREKRIERGWDECAFLDYLSRYIREDGLSSIKQLLQGNVVEGHDV